MIQKLCFFVLCLLIQSAGFAEPILAAYFYGEVEKIDRQNELILLRPIDYDLKKSSLLKIAYDETTRFFGTGPNRILDKGDQVSVRAEAELTEKSQWHAEIVRCMIYEGFEIH